MQAFANYFLTPKVSVLVRLNMAVCPVPVSFNLFETFKIQTTAARASYYHYF
jgi:hypothetical protein